MRSTLLFLVMMAGCSSASDDLARQEAETKARQEAEVKALEQAREEGAAQARAEIEAAAAAAAKAKKEAEIQAKQEAKAKAEKVAEGINGLISDPAFSPEKLKALKAENSKLVSFLESHHEELTEGGKFPEDDPGIKETTAFLESISSGIVDVDATVTAQTGARVQSGYYVRYDVWDGEWRAGKGSAYPLNPGTGDPKYTPGLLGDYRIYTNLPHGRLIGEVGGHALAMGVWAEYTGKTDVLKFKINDSYTSDNAGKLKVRYMVASKFPDLPTDND